MAEKVAHASRSGAGGGEEGRAGGDGEVVPTGDTILDLAGSSGFGHGIRALERSFLSGSSNSQEKGLASIW